jgi:hypothetical protein
MYRTVLSSSSPLILLAAGLALGVAAVACVADDDATKKNPLAVCEAGEKGCPSDKKDTKKTASSKSEEGTRLDSPQKADEPSSTDAGTASDASDASAVAPQEGPFCKELRTCCKTLEQAGYSPNTCLEIVNTKSENACVLQHKQYRDYGDCS